MTAKMLILFVFLAASCSCENKKAKIVDRLHQIKRELRNVSDYDMEGMPEEERRIEPGTKAWKHDSTWQSLLVEADSLSLELKKYD